MCLPTYTRITTEEFVYPFSTFLSLSTLHYAFASRATDSTTIIITSASASLAPLLLLHDERRIIQTKAGDAHAFNWPLQYNTIGEGCGAIRCGRWNGGGLSLLEKRQYFTAFVWQ